MVSETSLAAQQCRLREWAEQIRDCQNRAAGTSIIEWCSRTGIQKLIIITGSTGLEQLPKETEARQIVLSSSFSHCATDSIM